MAGRLRRLLIPALWVAASWMVIGLAIARIRTIGWLGDAIGLIVMPLWFLGIYALLVLLAPPPIRAHRRWGPIALVWLAGSAAVLDVLRFSHGQEWAGFVNFVVIWSFCHELGLHYRLLTEAPRQVGWMLLWAGAFALTSLTSFGLYPRSMVGIPGDRFSNMGPPTLAIVALLVLQVGLSMLVRPYVVDRLVAALGRAQRTGRPLLSAALPVPHLGVRTRRRRRLRGHPVVQPGEANAEWWLQRPLWLLLPIVFTVAIIGLAARVVTRSGGAAPVVPTEPERHDSERFW